MRVLVTGANGMVGRNLLDYLSTKGVETIPTDLSVQKLSGNLLEKDFVDSLESLDFDAIVHLAAVTDIKKTIENPKLCYEVNCFGTLNVLELAVKKRAKLGDMASGVANAKQLFHHFQQVMVGDHVRIGQPGEPFSDG